ncbi:MAG: hypothetical protein H6791_01630 [Candidatus Nomurabacteria bacterium]|nr:MAG: hypothetical protein H6791_01630 [Candidatus Nomurabacteria bacterium]
MTTTALQTGVFQKIEISEIIQSLQGGFEAQRDRDLPSAIRFGFRETHSLWPKSSPGVNIGYGKDGSREKIHVERPSGFMTLEFRNGKLVTSDGQQGHVRYLGSYNRESQAAEELLFQVREVANT